MNKRAVTSIYNSARAWPNLEYQPRPYFTNKNNNEGDLPLIKMKLNQQYLIKKEKKNIYIK